VKFAVVCAALVLSFGSGVFALSFTEIVEVGWGPGVDNTRPAIVDLDDDGLLDLLIGNEDGTLAHYEQTSVGSYDFTQISTAFCSIDVGTAAAPCLADLDGDGLLDLVVGHSGGRVKHFEQEEDAPYSFGPVPGDCGDLFIGTVVATPVIADLDADGLLDLIVGGYTGTLAHYEQAEIGSTAFALVSDDFNAISVSQRSVPQIADLDGDGLLDLVVGERRSAPLHYEQESAHSEVFTLVAGTFDMPELMSAIAPCFADLDGDGFVDMISGTEAGALIHHEQSPDGGLLPGVDSLLAANPLEVASMAAPCLTDLNGDGLLDLLIGGNDGRIALCTQDEPGSIAFNRVSDSLADVFRSYRAVPCVADLDSDGLLDILVGRGDGKLSHYEQTEAAGQTLTYLHDVDGIRVEQGGVTPCLTDIDADGLFDLLIGTHAGTVLHYEQSEADAETFGLVTESFQGIDTGYQARPQFTDLDADGLLDLIVVDGNGAFTHYEQIAAESETFVPVAGTFDAIPQVAFASPWLGDINGDGLIDILIGTQSGGIRCFLQSEQADTRRSD